MNLTTSLRYVLLFGFIGVATSSKLNVTAIGSHGGRSRFECWQLSTPFSQSNQNGVVGTAASFLGDVTNMTYNVIPSGFDGGFHTTPVNQWTILLYGLAKLTLPDSDSLSVTTSGGEFSLLFVADTPPVSKQGHRNTFPGVTETIFLQIPTKNGAIPAHTVLSANSPCSAGEYTALRGLAGSG
ncbi:hypothetical protein F5Y14DRAFT_444246 [Nemania sp. NC0429]|nr:hypothetical protein F5Y14DRAFT_444246 [Nemania sp. NC0429]